MLQHFRLSLAAVEQGLRAGPRLRHEGNYRAWSSARWQVLKSCGHSPVYHEVRSGNVAGAVAGKEDHQVGNLFRA